MLLNNSWLRAASTITHRQGDEAETIGNIIFTGLIETAVPISIYMIVQTNNIEERIKEERIAIEELYTKRELRSVKNPQFSV